MSFLSPIWLLGLPVFLAVAAWLLLGRRRRQWVAFLPLWRGPVRSPRMPQALEPPPIYLLLALAGILAALLAASRPVIRGLGTRRGVVHVVVDCGATMSVAHSGQTRFAELARAVRQPIFDALGPGPVQIIDVPRGQRQMAGADDWADITARLGPTGLLTRDALYSAVAFLLQQQAGETVIVLSDQHCPLSDPNLVQIAPSGRIEHVGIAELAVRQKPQAQVMVRLHNDSVATTGQLSVHSAGAATQAVLLSPRGTDQNYFFSVPLGDRVEATLSVPQEQAADHQAWAVLEGNAPRIEAHSALPPTLERMVRVYGALHPPRGDAPAVAFVRGFADLPAGEDGIALAQIPADATPAPSPVDLRPHPITSNLTQNDLAGASVAEDAPTAAGWDTMRQNRRPSGGDGTFDAAAASLGGLRFCDLGQHAGLRHLLDQCF